MQDCRVESQSRPAIGCLSGSEDLTLDARFGEHPSLGDHGLRQAVIDGTVNSRKPMSVVVSSSRHSGRADAANPVYR